MNVPEDALWRAFSFAPSPVWGQVNRQFRALFAHKWVHTTLVSSLVMTPHLADRVIRWRGCIEKLDILADDEGLCALAHLAGACPRLWSLSIRTRSVIQLHHAAVLKRMLHCAHVLTQFSLELVFPGSAPLPLQSGGVMGTSAADNGLLQLLTICSHHIFRNLREFTLTLNGCGLNDNACIRIVEALTTHCLPYITRINLCLSHNNIDVCGARAFGNWISSLPTLCDVAINIGHNHGAPGKIAQTFATAMESLTLRSLSIRMGSTQTPCGYRLPLFNFKNSNLECVKIDLGFPHPDDILAVFCAITPSVRHLSVCSNPHLLGRYPHRPNTSLAIDTFAVLPAHVLDIALSRYTHLQWLSLDFNGRCGTDTLQPLARSPTVVARLKRLQRIRLHIGGSHGHTLTDVCSVLLQLGSTVVHWDLGMTCDDMNDPAVTVLAQHLARCSMQHLRLDLSHNRIGPHGWTSLVSGIQKMDTLRTLQLKCNHNPIGYATAAVFESVRLVHVEVRDCKIRCVNNWISGAIRINLMVTPKEWTAVISDNDIDTHQCECMRKAGWVVVRE
jgi:hypothetical protein